MRFLFLLLLFIHSIALADSRVVTFDDTSVVSGDFLQYDGTDFVPKDIVEIVGGSTASLWDFEGSNYNNGFTVTYGCSGSCTSWPATTAMSYGINRDGWCSVWGRTSQTAPSGGSASYLTIDIGTWDFFNSAGDNALCGRAMLRIGSSYYPGFVFIVDNLSQMRIFREDLAVFLTSYSVRVDYHCYYRCDEP